MVPQLVGVGVMDREGERVKLGEAEKLGDPVGLLDWDRVTVVDWDRVMVPHLVTLRLVVRVPEVHRVRVWVGEREREPLEVTEVEPEKEVVPEAHPEGERLGVRVGLPVPHRVGDTLGLPVGDLDMEGDRVRERVTVAVLDRERVPLLVRVPEAHREGERVGELEAQGEGEREGEGVADPVGVPPPGTPAPKKSPPREADTDRVTVALLLTELQEESLGEAVGDTDVEGERLLVPDRVKVGDLERVTLPVRDREVVRVREPLGVGDREGEREPDTDPVTDRVAVTHCVKLVDCV